jgi:NAD(P)-dependent dehydrogenase (short-subunit alcohol dehydrogenase family)
VHKKAKGYPLDVTDEASVQALLPAVEEDFGQVDGLINMVSIFKPNSELLSYAEMQQQFTINAFGNMLLSRLFAESVKKRGETNAPIVSFIDWAVDHPYGNFDVYMAAKAALRHYLMSLQTTFAGVIRVVNIHPGMILEPPNFPAAQKESIVRNTPVKNIGTPEQAAKLVRTALELDFLVDNIRLAGGQQWRHRLSNDE